MTAAVSATKKEKRSACSEEALDQVAVFVLVLIKSPLDDSMAAGRDDGTNITVCKVLEKGVGVVGFICAERVRLKIA